ncbi:DUF3383 family protein [Rummeliibacillus stabekisii]|uniref:DUF3383 family protein n=1 Tax=Rummeliibacillus stabekisii TaxID=241244 RepID=UPI00371EDE4D
MPLKDVTVTINIQKSSKLTGLGKPLILAKFTGDSTYKNYADPLDVAKDFGADTVVHKLAKALINQGNTAPAKIAIATYDSAAEPAMTAADALRKFYDEDWYFVVSDTQVATEVKAIADVVEGKGVKLHGTTVTALEALTTLKGYNYDRTFAMLHTTVNEYAAEGLIGSVGSRDVGSITWKFKSINGLTPQQVTEDELKDIHALNGFAYVTKSGIPQTSEGKVLSGEYIDVIHSKDWIKINIEEAVQQVFVKNGKISYTDDGITLLANAVKSILKAAFDMGMIAEDSEGSPLYSVATVSRVDTPSSDRESRVYNGLSFNFELAGAIHEANIAGEIMI